MSTLLYRHVYRWWYRWGSHIPGVQVGYGQSLDSMKNKDTVTIELTRKEIDVLADYYDDREKRFVEMREYLMAQESLPRSLLFHALKQTGWYMGIKNYETTE